MVSNEVVKASSGIQDVVLSVVEGRMQCKVLLLQLRLGSFV